MLENLSPEIGVLIGILVLALSIIVITNQIRAGVYAKKLYKLHLEMNRVQIESLNQQRKTEEESESEEKTIGKVASNRIFELAKDLESDI